MVVTFEQMFGSKPKTYSSPLEKNDHPELDTSDELDAEGIRKFQALLGATQWAVSIGRLDVATAVMTLSKFRVAPWVGHMD